MFAAFQAAFGTDFAAGIGNVIDNIICILFAYWTNHTFVFKSENKGKAALGRVRAVCVLPHRHDGHGPGHYLGGRQPGWARTSALLLTNGKLWAMGVKLFSQVIVILSNYVFSKLLIFKKK